MLTRYTQDCEKYTATFITYFSFLRPYILRPRHFNFHLETESMPSVCDFLPVLSCSKKIFHHPDRFPYPCYFHVSSACLSRILGLSSPFVGQTLYYSWLASFLPLKSLSSPWYSIFRRIVVRNIYLNCFFSSLRYFTPSNTYLILMEKLFKAITLILK